MAEASTERKLKLGIVGIGVGASEILPAMEQMPEFELVAAADVNPRVLETFRQRYGAKTYDSVDSIAEFFKQRTPRRTDFTRRTRSSLPMPVSMSSSKNRWRFRFRKRSR